MSQRHLYRIDLAWQGNTGTGTTSYRGYSRDHLIGADGPGTLEGTADIAFRGVRERWNPEQLFLASLAQCHLLTYLWLAVGSGVNVLAYQDHPTGEITTHADGSGEFTSVTLHPEVTISADSDPALAEELHHKVADYCFIARSVSLSVTHLVTIIVSSPA